ncbi:MAG: rhodanese-like domain-containing protein [Rhodospirillaceae bacterium]
MKLPFRLIGLLVGLISLAALADDGILRADEALVAAQRGEIVIIDVRTPAEWRATGIPEGAKTADFSTPALVMGFVATVTNVVHSELTLPVALICRSGNRSTKARDVLVANGFTAVFNIKEGMSGSSYGPGWLARRLPVTDCSDCQ